MLREHAFVPFMHIAHRVESFLNDKISEEEWTLSMWQNPSPSVFMEVLPQKMLVHCINWTRSARITKRKVHSVKLHISGA